MVHGHGFDWLLSRDNLSREHGRISMHLPNVYVHRGALFPTFCILVFGEIKFYRNQLLSIVSPSSVDRLKSFLRNDQRLVVGERDSLEILVFFFFPFLKNNSRYLSQFQISQRGRLERKVFDWRKCSVRPPPRHKGRDTRGLSTWSLAFPSREEGEGDSVERRSGCPRGF